MGNNIVLFFFNYNYEKTYPYKVVNNHSYIPDFTLNLFEKDLLMAYDQKYTN